MKSTANITKWEENMIRHAEKAGKENTTTWEGHAWYYDGQRVFQQIAEYTKDNKWLQYADQSMGVYRKYLLDNNGRLPGWRLFPHGLYKHYLDTNDEQSKNSIILLSKNSAYAYKNGGEKIELSRETAYLLTTRIIHNKLIPSDNPVIDAPFNFAMEHLVIWRVPEITIQPFMVGLTCEALIYYYENIIRNPKIVEEIELTLNYVWDKCWNEERQAFVYDTIGGTPAPDLNLLIAPAFAFMHYETGDNKWLERGDKIFNGGVAGAYLAGGKQFTQNYRWSFAYVDYVKKLNEVEEDVPEPNPNPEDYEFVEKLEFENFKKDTDESIVNIRNKVEDQRILYLELGNKIVNLESKISGLETKISSLEKFKNDFGQAAKNFLEKL